MKVSRLLFAAILVGLAVGLSACAVVSPTTPNSFSFDPPVQQPKNPSAVKLKLSTGAQRLYVVEGDNVLLATPVTVGTASAPTPHGNYTIYLKVANRRRQSSPGAGYPMTVLDGIQVGLRSALGLCKTISQHARLRPHADRCCPQDFPIGPCRHADPHCEEPAMGRDYRENPSAPR